MNTLQVDDHIQYMERIVVLLPLTLKCLQGFTSFGQIQEGITHVHVLVRIIKQIMSDKYMYMYINCSNVLNQSTLKLVVFVIQAGRGN